MITAILTIIAILGAAAGIGAAVYFYQTNKQLQEKISDKKSSVAG